LVDQVVVVQKAVEEDQQDQQRMVLTVQVEMVQREALLEAVQREDVLVYLQTLVAMDKAVPTVEVVEEVLIIMQEATVEFLVVLVVWDGPLKTLLAQEERIPIHQELVVMAEEVK
jgi:uncharacterized protein GlcG (DUF336 family)